MTTLLGGDFRYGDPFGDLQTNCHALLQISCPDVVRFTCLSVSGSDHTHPRFRGDATEGRMQYMYTVLQVSEESPPFVIHFNTH